MNYGIDPFFDRANLVYGPLKGHTNAYDDMVLAKLKKAVERGGTYDQIQERIRGTLQEIAAELIK